VDGLVQHSYFLYTSKVVSDMCQVLAGTPFDEISDRKYVNKNDRYRLLSAGNT
jgi:hypothetical protein